MSRRAAGVVVPVVVVVLALVAGLGVWNLGRSRWWWGTSDAQQALLSDPMAAPDLDGLTLLYAEEAQPVGVAGKSPGAFVKHWFEPRLDAVAQVADLGSYAAAHGWMQDPTRSNESVWLGSRRTESGSATLVVAVEGARGPALREGMDGKVRVFLTL